MDHHDCSRTLDPKQVHDCSLRHTLCPEAAKGLRRTAAHMVRLCPQGLFTARGLKHSGHCRCHAGQPYLAVRDGLSPFLLQSPQGTQLL